MNINEIDQIYLNFFGTRDDRRWTSWAAVELYALYYKVTHHLWSCMGSCFTILFRFFICILRKRFLQQRYQKRLSPRGLFFVFTPWFSLQRYLDVILALDRHVTWADVTFTQSVTYEVTSFTQPHIHCYVTGVVATQKSTFAYSMHLVVNNVLSVVDLFHRYCNSYKGP